MLTIFDSDDFTPCHASAEVPVDPIKIEDLLTSFEALVPSPAVAANVGSDGSKATNAEPWRKDHWRQEPGCWIRVHERPRRALFSPLGTSNGPDSSVLSVTRVTYVEYLQPSASEVINDVWVRSDSHRMLDRRWTGRSIFQLSNGISRSLDFLAESSKPVVEILKPNKKYHVC